MKLFVKELWDLRWRGIVLFVFTLLTGYFVLANHEWFMSMVDISQIEQGLKQAPFLNKILDMETLNRQLLEILNNIDFYVWSQWFGKNLYQLILLAIIILAFPLFARETEQKTHYFLLSHRTRKNIFLNKIMAGFFSIFLIIAAGSILPAMLAPFHGFDFGLLKAFMYALHLTISSLLLFSVVVFFSITFDDVIKPVIASVIVFITLGLAGNMFGMYYLDIYRYMTGVDIFFTDSIQAIALLLILLIALLVLFGSWHIFKNKDF
jgi:ABC-type transport system involved in multi-copper enzyme maturation permease subunit